MADLKKKIIIFGAGNTEKNITTYITENYENIICIVDNDSKKWNQERNGYPIMPPDHICNYQSDESVILVIATFLYHDEIKKQLADLGWEKERMVVAIDEIPFFKSMEFMAYLQNTDLYNPVPTLLNVELSGYCNCKCVYCPFHGEPGLKNGHKGFMSWETMEAIIKWVKKIPSINTVDTTGPGEIFLNRNWFEMLEELLVSTNIEYVIIYTNGMLLTEDNVKKITSLSAKKVKVEISIDGKTPEENDEYRIGAKYTVIRDNIYAARKIFASTPTKVELIITNCNPATLEEIEESNYQLDSKYNDIPQFLQDDFEGIALTSQKTFYYGKGELSKFKTVEIEWPENERNGCLNLFYRLPISYEGKLLRCSCGQAGIDGIGSVFSDDILELWYNDELIQKARKNFLEKNLEEDFCTGCPGKGKGKYNILIKK